ncbi:hypothetical protein GCM10009119_42890 [Algoriphagus jejuensis]|uniref:Uncharacterized protein n=1 Tax=Algoriphagus jejuensis TaxID=419934 RepID=A0ABP3YLA1_9BACT
MGIPTLFCPSVVHITEGDHIYLARREYASDITSAHASNSDAGYSQAITWGYKTRSAQHVAWDDGKAG